MYTHSSLLVTQVLDTTFYYLISHLFAVVHLPKYKNKYFQSLSDGSDGSDGNASKIFSALFEILFDSNSTR